MRKVCALLRYSRQKYGEQGTTASPADLPADSVSLFNLQ